MKIPLKQSGYTLVEIALVLTIVLMISSLLAVKYYQVQRDARNAEVARSIGLIKEAIMDYAAANGTRSRLIDNLATTLAVQWRLPAGRPYLPCPDITGDGLEDRSAIPAIPKLFLNAAFGLVPGEIFGNCSSNKGVVPWRTLGTPPADPWGNFYTYRVDDDFSGALLGFDERSRSDQSYLSRPLLVSVVGGVNRAIRQVAPLAANITRPPVGFWVAGINNVLDPSIICNRAPCPGNVATLTLVAGVINTDPAANIVTHGDLTWDGAVSYPLAVGAVAAGVPVVVLSHGKNGHGAVRGNRISGFICNPTPTLNADEGQNAYWNTAINQPADNAICPDNSAVAGTGAFQNGFVSHPRSEGDNGTQEFDDIVGWISVSDLEAGMRKRRIFPTELLPPIGLEDF